MSNINKEFEELLKNADLTTAKLTDENIEDISKAVEDMAKDSATAKIEAKAAELKANTEIKNEEVSASIILNPITGKPMMVEEFEDEDDNLLSFEEMLEDPNITPQDIDIESLTIKNDNVEQVIGATFQQLKMSTADYTTIIDAVNRVKRGEKFGYFNALPESLQSEINGLIGANMGSQMGSFYRQGRNHVALSLLQDIINSSTTDMAVYNLNKAIQSGVKTGIEEMKSDKYWNQIRHYLLEGTKVKAAELSEKGEIEKAETYLKVREAFIQSYTYENMKAAYLSGKIRIKKIMIEKFNRTCKEFDLLYQKSQNIIEEISLALPTLDRNAHKKFDIDIIKEFICIFIQYVKNNHMNPNDIVDHTFMYYFINNILTCDFYNKDSEEDVQFHDQLINNINNFLELIVDKKAKKE